jgi:hypothetical protein
MFAPIRKLVVHHTASDNRPSNPADVVRFVHRHHVVDRGFADIGYNFLVDHKGNIYEGRYSRRFGDEPISGEDHNGRGVVGAHAKSMNAGTCGICLIGNFDVERPTDAALASLQWLLAWKSSRHRIDAGQSDQFGNVYGEWKQFANVAGHRNVGQTACPGSKLDALLPTLRNNVTAQAGHWDPLIADIPALLRYEWSTLGQGPLSGGWGGLRSGAGSSTGSSNSPAGASAGESTGQTATTVRGYRVVTTAGQVFSIGKVSRFGQPGAGAGPVVAMANPGWGDGYLTLASSGKVTAYGSMTALGDVAESGGGPAADLAVTASGAGYWVLMADGGIYPFGDARYFGSPKRSGLTAASLRIAPRPQGDGYWVLTADGAVTAFGNAPPLGGPGAVNGKVVHLAATHSGAGYWVLYDNGDITAHGDAPDTGGIPSKKTKWTKPASAITAAGANGGYVISANDGGLFSFNGAPYFGSFAGSGATVVGVVPAAT